MKKAIALLDACVLYPFSVRDVLIQFAFEEIYQAKWSKKIETEVIRNVEKNNPTTKGKLSRTFKLMEDAVPDFSAEPSPAAIQEVASTATDPKDVEILAAAIENACTHLVTFNLKDFDISYALGRRVSVIHPDEFLEWLIDNNSSAAKIGFDAVVARCKNPPRSKADYYNAIKNNNMPKTASKLAAL